MRTTFWKGQPTNRCCFSLCTRYISGHITKQLVTHTELTKYDSRQPFRKGIMSKMRNIDLCALYFLVHFVWTDVTLKGTDGNMVKADGLWVQESGEEVASFGKKRGARVRKRFIDLGKSSKTCPNSVIPRFGSQSARSSWCYCWSEEYERGQEVLHTSKLFSELVLQDLLWTGNKTLSILYWCQDHQWEHWLFLYGSPNSCHWCRYRMSNMAL